MGRPLGEYQVDEQRAVAGGAAQASAANALMDQVLFVRTNPRAAATVPSMCMRLRTHGYITAGGGGAAVEVSFPIVIEGQSGRKLRTPAHERRRAVEFPGGRGARPYPLTHLISQEEDPMNDTATERAFSLGAGEGEARWWLGSLATIKATSEQTGGSYALVEVLEPQGVEAPLHVHHREDEGFWVLEGQVTFRIGDREIQAGPGSFVFGPRGVPHTYRVDSQTARLLFILSPAGMEGFIRASSEPAASLTVPPSEGVYDESEMEGLMALAREYGTEILG